MFDSLRASLFFEVDCIYANLRKGCLIQRIFVGDYNLTAFSVMRPLNVSTRWRVESYEDILRSNNIWQEALLCRKWCVLLYQNALIMTVMHRMQRLFYWFDITFQKLLHYQHSLIPLLVYNPNTGKCTLLSLENMIWAPHTQNDIYVLHMWINCKSPWDSTR